MDETTSRCRETGNASRFDAPEDYRAHYNSHYAQSGMSWDTLAPLYEFGARLAEDPRFCGRPWSQIEPEVETHYLAGHPDGAWDQVKEAVHYGWESVAGLRREERREAA